MTTKKTNKPKSTLKILLFCVTLALISGCSAERRIQRIVKNHPELIEVRARSLDTIITVPGYTDCTILPISTISTIPTGETYYKTTDHGAFIISAGNEDSTVCIAFAADSQKVQFQDTIQYRQIVIKPEKTRGVGEMVSEWIVFVAIGIVSTLFLLKKIQKTNKS